MYKRATHNVSEEILDRILEDVTAQRDGHFLRRTQMSIIDEMQSDIELKAYFIQELEEKVNLLERKLELVIKQRDKTIVDTKWLSEARILIKSYDKELEELK